MSSIEICVFLWQDPKAKHQGNFTYTPRHVNTLFRALVRGEEALGTDIRFNVITDHPKASDFDPGIRYVPLWKDYRDLGRCFTRLKLLDSEYRTNVLGFSPKATVIQMDIDLCVVNPKGFLENVLKDYRQAFTGYRDSKNPRVYSGALWKIDPRYGSVDHVYKSFDHIYRVSKITGTTEAFFRGWNAGYMEPDHDLKKMVNTGYVGSDQCWIVNALGEHTFPVKLNGFENGVWDFWQIEDLPFGSLPGNCNAVMVNGLRRDVSMESLHAKYPWLSEYWNS